MKKPIIILTGPTAVGKTKASIELAQKIGGEIISADSMQIYQKMDIGTAKITPEEMQGVPHYLIDELDPSEKFNVVAFVEKSKEAMKKIYASGHIPIIVGGTGFYIQALLYDIDFSQHEDKESLVYTFKGKKDTNKTEHVSIMPNTGSKGDHLYMHAFLIADYEIVDSLKQLTNKQHMMACGTTFIDIHQDTANNPIDLNNNYDLIDYTSDLLKHDEEGYFDNNLLIQFPNNLEGNFKKNKPITIKMSGISDDYILWILEDLKPVSSYHIELPKNKSAVLSYKPGNKTKNVKAIAIPLSSNLPEESTSLVVK